MNEITYYDMTDPCTRCGAESGQRCKHEDDGSDRAQPHRGGGRDWSMEWSAGYAAAIGGLAYAWDNGFKAAAKYLDERPGWREIHNPYRYPEPPAGTRVEDSPPGHQLMVATDSTNPERHCDEGVAHPPHTWWSSQSGAVSCNGAGVDPHSLSDGVGQ